MDEVSKYIQDKVADTLQGFLDHDIEYDMDKTIQELRKENAELKSKLKEIEESDSVTELKFLRDASKSAERDVRNAYKNGKLEGIAQLTKAKELLQRFIETINPIYFEEDRQKVKTQAEQFLKELEK